MRSLSCLIIAVLFCAPLRLAAQTDPDARIAQDAVQLFGTACLQQYPDPTSMARWIREHHVRRIDTPQHDAFTQGRPGNIYAVERHGVRFLLVVERGNMCSVYVRRVDPAHALAVLGELRAGLTESGALTEDHSSERRHTATGTITTTDYTYRNRKGTPVLLLTVSTSASTHGFYQFAISASMATRHTSTAPSHPH